ncbi:MAG: hypothetical protein CVU77_01345 [Elusimicrobia bacterium HGW-Elusimicrobia-1]|jgi:hypothetical protein|nr:MAG: hypothetical protein CVU77_01345 [Elusimicrobia bacterium HGW-Elusimicrobia-1]
MKKSKTFLSVALLVVAFASAGRICAQLPAGAGAFAQWGNFQKKIALQRGVGVSAWEDRGDISYEQYGMYAATMSPVGDGTYQIKFDLYPGAEYNFAFFAVSTTPLAGVTTGLTYFDAVPNHGSDAAFIASTSPAAPLASDTRSAEYRSIGGDARRYVAIPDLAQGTTFYVFSNWASTPSAPTDLRARPGDSKVHLTWGAPYGWWGTGSQQYKAIDVIAGGAYVIYRSSVAAGGPYEIVASTPGHCFSWTDTNVQNGVRYYYAVSSSDAYKGDAEGVLGDVNLCSDAASSQTPGASPGQAVPIRFRVEGIDWKVIKEKGYLAWLTPNAASDGAPPCPPARIPARLVEVKLSKTLKDRISDAIRWLL